MDFLEDINSDIVRTTYLVNTKKHLVYSDGDPYYEDIPLDPDADSEETEADHKKEVVKNGICFFGTKDMVDIHHPHSKGLLYGKVCISRYLHKGGGWCEIGLKKDVPTTRNVIKIVTNHYYNVD